MNQVDGIDPVEESPLKESFEEIFLFLKSVLPFKMLNDPEIRDIAKTMKRKGIPPGEIVIRQGTQGEFFHLVRSGLVKVFLLDEENRETVLGFLGEGDCFGEISLLTQGPTTAGVQTIEPTSVLIQDRQAFLAMTREHPIFYQFFNQLMMHRMRAVYRELLTENPGVAQVEPFLYRKQVSEMVSPVDASCSLHITIHEATRKILDDGLTSLVALEDGGRPRGIVRLSRIAREVLLGGIPPQEPVEKVLEQDFYSIDGKSYFFDALHGMIKHRTNELVVVEGDRIAGILTGLDLLRFRGREVLSLLRNIEEAPDLPQLNAMKTEVEKVLRALMNDGALASHACKIVSEFNDKMVRRVLQLAEAHCGPPPVPYVWFGLGSEGRKEQTLLTDQDNAILFSFPSPAETPGYFHRLSTWVVEGLHQCGIPICKGGVMASNPDYFGNLDQWKTRTTQWIKAPASEGKELMDIYVFLDFRSVYGDPALEKDLKIHVLSAIREHPAFLKTLAQPMVSIPIPIGFFKNFIVEKSGKYKNRLNLKLYGLVPLITCLKVLALQHEVMETNTLERIRALAQGKVLSSDQAEGLEQAFETFLTLRIKNNLRDIEQGQELSNHVDPAGLSTRQKQVLKEAFWAVSELQKTTQKAFNVEDHDPGWVR